ncbi:hypothetical protein QR680_003998 [Steinernema hermaphroditum]|uniref:Uncharacterized protein n=1 Tax=Steinernema hermaphroditum TaxID=289476 RepID=A0AA39HMB8_9BILA|nr:hypothetical protein QR680_003998 [Steinernema hermaphroditum]
MLAASTSAVPPPKDRGGDGGGFACELCPPSIRIANRIDFAHHLRAVHCTKEGGSFICRYGPNNVCQTLPVEGVADHDYELHLRKYHINNGTLSLTYDTFSPKIR